MKLITAVIRPETLETAHRALAAFGAPGITVTPILADSRWNRHLEVYRATVLVADLVPRLRIDVVVHDEDADDLVDLLLRIGDGRRPVTPGRPPSPQSLDDTVRVWISRVEQAVRVRTGEHGDAAV